MDILLDKLDTWIIFPSLQLTFDMSKVLVIQLQTPYPGLNSIDWDSHLLHSLIIKQWLQLKGMIIFLLRSRLTLHSCYNVSRCSTLRALLFATCLLGCHAQWYHPPFIILFSRHYIRSHTQVSRLLRS